MWWLNSSSEEPVKTLTWLFQGNPSLTLFPPQWSGHRWLWPGHWRRAASAPGPGCLPHSPLLLPAVGPSTVMAHRFCKMQIAISSCHSPACNSPKLSGGPQDDEQKLSTAYKALGVLDPIYPSALNATICPLLVTLLSLWPLFASQSCDLPHF